MNNKISWGQIDITPLRPIGFSYQDLNEIAEQSNLSPDDVQTAINHFARELGRGNEAAARVKIDILPKIIHFRSKHLQHFKKLAIEELIKLGQCLYPTPKSDDEPISIKQALEKWQDKFKQAVSIPTDEELLRQKLYSLSDQQLSELLVIYWYGFEVEGIGEFDNWARFCKDAEQWVSYKSKEEVIEYLLEKGSFSKSIRTTLDYVV